ESLAKRTFRGWDTRLALLAAREYLVAGRLEDCERLLGRAGGDVRGDDLVLMSRLQAELALAQGRPSDAIAALRRIPEPWPAPLASELLGIRARAELASGQLLDGIRSTEARASVLGTPDERRENYAHLVDAMLADPDATAAVPADATPGERAWFELGQLLAAPNADGAATARRAADWRSRHPHHPGGDFLPQAAPGSTISVEAADARVVALLVPTSGRLAAAGRAVRDGFLAAALDDPPSTRPRIEILDTASLGASAAYARAIEIGAGAVAGPLAKEDIAALLASQPLPVPTLALNSVAAGTPPPFLFQFALDPEQEARAVARRIVRDGHVRGVALFPRSAWGERVQAAFVQELDGSAVVLTSVQPYDPAARDFSGPLRAALGRYGGAGDRDPTGAPVKRDAVAEARDGPQFVFLAASAASARAIVPQLRFQMTYEPALYATSDAVDPGPRAVPDLEGLVYPEMPWIISGGLEASPLWDVLQREWAAEARGRTRLYAFGYDAYRLLRGMSAATRGVAVGGLTGRLQVTPDGHVQRQPDWGQIQGGRPRAAGVALLPAVPGDP
ncbi:MAG: penicillin-binding protein activator, partial [Vicinamibacterales bacterium]|nr:penicillin-binding protein activator [Vicinamibacterales bacterium]